jgi:hypothetical protein
MGSGPTKRSARFKIFLISFGSPSFGNEVGFAGSEPNFRFSSMAFLFKIAASPGDIGGRALHTAKRQRTAKSSTPPPYDENKKLHNFAITVNGL